MFKDKKKVWIAHLDYLLNRSRYEEAYALSKRALPSLPSYKHIKTTSKFAQLVFENGNAQKARTLFDGLLLKYPKRLDLLFVYIDKETKTRRALLRSLARSLFVRVGNPNEETRRMKLSDKQMKGLFKKWYLLEEKRGMGESREREREREIE